MPSKKHKIYLLTNTHTDKAYVGYTGQKYMSSRMGKHRQESRRGKDTHLYRAMRLYGERDFSYQILGEFDDLQEAKNAEKLWIILLNAKHSDHGYNTTDGGEAPKHSEETKLKISRIQKENPKPIEFYRAINRLSKTPEARAKHSISMREAWASGAFDSRKKKTRKIKDKVVKKPKERKDSEGTRGSIGSKGWSHSEETKSRMSAAQHKRYESIEAREITRVGQKKRQAAYTPETRPIVSEETRKKMSESGKKAWERKRGSTNE